MSERKLKPGTRICLCRGCGQYFGGVTTFEQHRINLECVDPGSLKDAADLPRLVLDSRGIWVARFSEAKKARSFRQVAV